MPDEKFPPPSSAPQPPNTQIGGQTLDSICVFCGSRSGNHPEYLESARQIGKMLARQNRKIVYGGGHVGMMGALADAALAQGGHVMGVIPKSLMDRELGHTALTELHIVDSMHQRKAMMAQNSDAFIALPGGIGTYEEILEAATWALLGIQDKPLGLLNIRGFFDPMLNQLDLARQEGFMLPEERALILHATNPENLLHQLATFCRQGPPKWMDITQL